MILHKAAIETVSNHPIVTRRGERFRADLAIPERGILIEYQGDYHRDPQQFRADMTRTSKLEAEGWYVMQLNANDLSHPHELIERVLQVIAGRAAR